MILALHGKAGSGKDTFANEFVKLGFRKIAFADPVKRLVMSMFFIKPEFLWGESDNRDIIDPRYGMSSRDLCLKIGTEFGRGVDDDLWVTHLDHTLEQMNTGRFEYVPEVGLVGIDCLLYPPKIIITDCRFLNEFKYLTGRNIPVLKIVRDDQKNIDHESETELDSVDVDEFSYIINNNGISLEKEARNIIESYNS